MALHAATPHRPPTVEEYLWRDDDGAWWQAEGSGEGRVPFPYPLLTLSLADIYEGLLPIRP